MKRIITLLFVISSVCIAQWHNANFPSSYKELFTSITLGKNGLIFVTTEADGIFRSTDGGSTWVKTNKGLGKVGDKYYTRQIAVNPITSKVFCFSGSKIYSSTDLGDNWLLNSANASGMNGTNFRFDNEGNVYIANGMNILFSSNDGVDWKVVSDGLLSQGQLVAELQISTDNSVYALTSGHLYNGFNINKLFKLNKQSNKWIELNSPFNGWSPFNLFIDSKNQLYTLCGDVYKSSDGGANWTKIFSDPSIMGIRSLFIDPLGVIYVILPEEIGMQSYSRIYYSKDEGISWNKSGYKIQFVVFASDGEKIYSSSGNGIIISSDYGNNWKNSCSGLPNSASINVMAATTNGTLVVGAGGISPYTSKNNGVSWEALKFGWYYDPYDVTCIATNENGMMMLGAKANGGNGSCYSTDFGATWNTIYFNDGIPNSAVVLPNNKFFATVSSGNTYKGPVARKTDGNVFESVTNNAQSEYYTFLVGTENNYLLAINNITTKNGSSEANSIKRSTDNGTNWTTVYGGAMGPTPVKKVTSLNYCGNGLLFAGSDLGVLRSTNYGDEWNVVDTTQSHYSLANFVKGKADEIYAGNKTGLFTSLDNGITWDLIDSSFNVTSLVIDKNGYLFIGTYEQGIYTNAPFQDTADTTHNKPIPDSYSLSQNYPNPFNPTTTINYQIPSAGHVSLKVYDILGREIATLVNEEKSAGNYEVKFDGSSLSSGVYFYRLQAGPFSETKKFVLIK